MILMVMIYNLLFLIVVSLPRDLRISTAGNRKEIVKTKHFKTKKNNNIFHLIDQTNVLKVPL